MNGRRGDTIQPSPGIHSLAREWTSLSPLSFHIGPHRHPFIHSLVHSFLSIFFASDSASRAETGETQEASS